MINFRLELIDYWVECIFQITEKLNRFKGVSMQLISNSANLPLLLISFLSYNIPQRDDMKECLIIFSENAQIASNINKIKEKMLEVFIRVFSFINSSTPKEEFKSVKFFQYLPQLSDIIFRTFDKIMQVTGQNIQDIFANQTVHNLFVTCLKCLSSIGNLGFFGDSLHQFQNFTVEILFPLLKTSKKELQDFVESPDEFVNLALDTCEKQFSKVYKTSAANYLETLADHIDGFLSFLIKICVEAIDFSFKSTDLNALSENNYPLLFLFKESQFVKYFPLEARIDVSLISISILSYLVTKRVDLKRILESTILRNSNELFNENLHHDLFLAPEQENIYQEMISYLVRSSLYSDPKNAALSIQGIEALNSLFEDVEMKSKVSPYIGNFFGLLIETISNHKSIKVFDMFQELLSSYGETILHYQNNMILFIQKVIQRIDEEQKNFEESAQPVINKCFNLIKTIIDKKEFVLSIQNEIDSLFTPLFVWLEKMQEINFDDDLIHILTIILKTTKIVFPFIEKAFNTFHEFYQKGNCQLSFLYNALNSLLLFGGNFFRTDKSRMTYFMRIVFDSLYNSEIDRESNCAEAALLLQLLIQVFALIKTHYDILNFDDLAIVFKACLDRIQKHIKKDFLLARIYGVFLSGICFNPTLTQEVLLKNNCIEIISKLLFNRSEVYINSYDKKVTNLSFSYLFLQHVLFSNQV